MSLLNDSPIESFPSLSDELGVDLLVKRDDLLPFPLAGNKIRKIRAELMSLPDTPGLVITNGAIGSNHCRTLAFLAARSDFSAHLVLHGEPSSTGNTRALHMLESLGATWEIVDAQLIAPTIAERRASAAAGGTDVHVINGGCHTPAGAVAYRDAATALLLDVEPDWVILASGTGATQGGIAAAAQSHAQTRVVGISVARPASRGSAPVAEAASWAGAEIEVDFRDSHLDGGYGAHAEITRQAVDTGWRHGLPLDTTYTGKAMAGLLSMISTGEIAPGARVLFWHTGGLANYLLGGDLR